MSLPPDAFLTAATLPPDASLPPVTLPRSAFDELADHASDDAAAAWSVADAAADDSSQPGHAREGAMAWPATPAPGARADETSMFELSSSDRVLDAFTAASDDTTPQTGPRVAADGAVLVDEVGE